MTDTTILDGLMATLQRNPLIPDRLKYVDRQFVQTDERPFYARRESIKTADMNPLYAERVDLFHHDLKAPRWERPRSGTCNRVRVVERHIDGEVWTRTERCPGIVHAVETKVNGAVRVDGKCLTCGWEVHRAGFLDEKG